MRSRRPLIIAAVATAAAAALAWATTRAGAGAVSSALSRGPDGLLIARRYLEARGHLVALQDGPLGPDAAAGRGAETLILALPLQRLPSHDELLDLDRHVRDGATLVLAYASGGHPFDAPVARALGLDLQSVRDPPPLDPWRWWSFAKEEWALTPDADALPAARELVIPAPRSVPRAPDGARILYRERVGGEPAVFEFGHGRGRIIVLPVAAWTNSGIGAAPGNADLLESVHLDLGVGLTFDEYHHGLVRREIATSRVAVAWDLLLAHLALLYVAALAALTRPFGPVWPEAVPSGGSTASFLRQLGAVHARLGHDEAAKRLLIERASQYDPRLELPPDLPATTTSPFGELSLVAVARALARVQRRGR